MKITDGKRTVEIRMMIWQETGFSPDWSNDYFGAGQLPYDDETEAYTVQDVEYCIDAAREWESEEENNMVFVDEIEA